MGGQDLFSDSPRIAGAMTPVMIVGDIAILLENELSDFGFDCTIADSGNEAVPLMSQRLFPVVIVATSLQDMTGVEFTRSLLKHVATTQVVLYGSGVSDVEAQDLLATRRVRCMPSSASSQDIGMLIARMVQSGNTVDATAAPNEFAMFSDTPTSEFSINDPAPAPAGPQPTPPEVQIELEELRGRVARAEERLLAASGERERMLGELERSTAERNRLQGEAQRLHEELQRGNDELAGIQRLAESTAVDAQAADELRLQVTELRSSLDAAQHRIAELESTAQRLELERDERSSLLATTELEAAEQGARANDLEQRLDDTKADSDEMRTRISGLEEMLGEARRECQTLEQQRTSARAEAEELRARVAEGATRNARREAELAKLNSELDRLRETSTQQHATIEANRAEHEALSAEIARMLHNSELKEAQLATIADERDELIRKLDDAELQAQSRGAEHSTLEQELSKRADELELDLASKEEEMVELENERDAALAQLSDMESELGLFRDTQEEMVGLRRESNKAIAERKQLLATIEGLRKDLRAAEAAGDLDIVDDVEIRQEVSRRTRSVASLIRAIDPFIWGLEQAIEFLTGPDADSAARNHVRQLTLLLSVLKRFGEEVSADEVEAMAEVEADAEETAH